MAADTKAARKFADAGDNYTGAEVRLWVHGLADEVDRLRAALEKIADWQGAWGPFPERNELWRGMAVTTAREAVPPAGGFELVHRATGKVHRRVPAGGRLVLDSWEERECEVRSCPE